jgi:hypothetical protein
MGLTKESLIVAAALTVAAPGTAFAQQTYRWVSESGRVEYSDQLPPSNARERRVLKAPLPAGGASAREGTGKVAAAKPSTLAEQEAAFRKRAAEREKAGKEAELRLAAAKSRSEDCERAKRDLALLASGARVQRIDAKGELYWIDDTQRAHETAQLQGVVARTCRQ